MEGLANIYDHNEHTIEQCIFWTRLVGFADISKVKFLDHSLTALRIEA
jgi:hypothetical protein